MDRFGNVRPPPPDCFSDDNLPAGVESGDDFWDMPDPPVFPAGPGPIALAERLVYRFTGEGEDPFVGEDLEDFSEMHDAGFISRDHIAQYAVDSQVFCLSQSFLFFLSDCLFALISAFICLFEFPDLLLCMYSLS